MRDLLQLCMKTLLSEKPHSACLCSLAVAYTNFAHVSAVYVTLWNLFENLVYARGSVQKELLRWSYLKSSRTVLCLTCLLTQPTHKNCEGL